MPVVIRLVPISHDTVQNIKGFVTCESITGLYLHSNETAAGIKLLSDA